MFEELFCGWAEVAPIAFAATSDPSREVDRVASEQPLVAKQSAGNEFNREGTEFRRKFQRRSGEDK